MHGRIAQLEAELEATRAQLEPFLCPHCGAPQTASGVVQLDERSDDYFQAFECGHTTGGWNHDPCPSDPTFPKLEEYEFSFQETQSGGRASVACVAIGKTTMAQRLNLSIGTGDTQDEARTKIVEYYQRRARPWGRR
jgi:hypothetical protein